MASSNVNVVVVTGNLTRDPELRSTRVGPRSASFGSRSTAAAKNAHGEWVDKPNYFDVTVWGAQGENCANYLSKGRPVAVEGRLDWREWEDKEGNKRQTVEIIANTVQFLGSRDGSGGGNGNGGFSPSSDTPANTSDFEPAAVGAGGEGGGNDDIPF